MRVAVDTNGLAYAEGLDDPARRVAALEVLERFSADEAAQAVAMWGTLHATIPTTDAEILAAAQLVSTHRLAFSAALKRDA